MPKEHPTGSVEAIILAHLPDITTLCNRMFRNRADAEDAVQQAAIELMRSLGNYRSDGPVGHYILKITYHAALGLKRKLAKQTKREKPMEATIEHSPAPSSNKEDEEAVRSAITELNQDLQAIVILHYYHRMTQQEIAAIVGCSQKTVCVRLRKGLGILNRNLSGAGMAGVSPATALLHHAKLDTVSETLVTAVRTKLATAAATAGVPVIGSSIAGAAINTGGMIMKTKLIVAAVAVAACGYVAGGSLSAARQTTLRLKVEHQVAAAQQRVGEKEAEIVELNAEVSRLRATLDKEAATAETLRRTVSAQESMLATLQRDAVENESPIDPILEPYEIEALLAGVFKLQEKVRGPGGMQFAPLLVAEMGKLTAEQFRQLLAFDEVTEDPDLRVRLSNVLLTSFAFMPNKTGESHGPYMEKYLERIQSGWFDQETSEEALHRISWSLPPIIDFYAKLVDPLEEPLKRNYLSYALDRVHHGSGMERRGAVQLLGRMPYDEATSALLRILDDRQAPDPLRSSAVKGLATRADRDVLRTLQRLKATDQSPTVLAALKTAIPSVIALIEGQLGDEH